MFVHFSVIYTPLIIPVLYFFLDTQNVLKHGNIEDLNVWSSLLTLFSCRFHIDWQIDRNLVWVCNHLWMLEPHWPLMYRWWSNPARTMHIYSPWTIIQATVWVGLPLCNSKSTIVSVFTIKRPKGASTGKSVVS